MGKIDYFRKPSLKDDQIFQSAVVLKELLNSAFSGKHTITDQFKDKEFHFIDTKYIPLKDSNKPDELNIYIRKIETIYRKTLDINNIPRTATQEKVDVVEEWTKSYLPNSIIEDSLFYGYLKLIHSLRFANSISSEFSKDKAIIFFNIELLSKSDIDNSFSLSQLEDEIYDILQSLFEKAEQNNWIIIENYKDFSKKNELINWMNLKYPDQKSYSKVFNNDFVLLNNTDSLSSEVDSKFIDSDILLEQNFELNINDKDKYFCYTRSYKGAEFTRNTIFLPKRYRKLEIINELSTLIKDINSIKDSNDVR